MAQFSKLYLQFIIIVLIQFISIASSYSQKKVIDSLMSTLAKVDDITKVKLMLTIAEFHTENSKYDTALMYRFKALQLAERIENNESLYQCLKELSRYYEINKYHDKALEFGLRAERIALAQNNNENLFEILNLVGETIYFNKGDYSTCLEYEERMMRIAVEEKDSLNIAIVLTSLGDIYRNQKKFGDAETAYSKGLKIIRNYGNKGHIIFTINNFAVVYEAQNSYKKALEYYSEAFSLAEEAKLDPATLSTFSANVSRTHLKLINYKLAYEYATEAQSLAEQSGNINRQREAFLILKNIYVAQKDYENAYAFLNKANILKDSTDSQDIQKSLSAFQEKYAIDNKDNEIVILQNKSRLQLMIRNILIGSSVLLIIIVFLITKQFLQKRKSQADLQLKNSELNNTIEKLKSTQSQLIQSEKMASLGELTAGIAHEIQNPLNFVNNFSEVSNELIDEMKTELAIGNLQPATEIADDVKQNLEKISHHGKRAADIVKGMLQHSRSSSGLKEPTDINALCDEYLRLSYHGLRAKDKSFNAKFETDFDQSIPKINVVTQDIGRVVLNLINNAFYAVNEQRAMNNEQRDPLVIVSTKNLEDKIEIRVTDNGNGIPQNIVDKIFQPFFTTKPTGQGTGLGLSLSYDIVTKGHGGNIEVKTTENGTEFIVKLPA